MTKPKNIVWTGPEAWRPYLVEISSLEPWPDNPRRGNVSAIREMLRELGQKKLSVVVNGSRIVTGHHVVEAARDEGWTHIAAVDGDFADEEEARRFLVGDNRASELGFVDEGSLAKQLAALRDLRATGYSADDRRELEERLSRLRRPTFAPSEEPPPQLDERSPGTGLFEVPLLLGREERSDFARLVNTLKREWGLEETTAVVVRAVREAAQRT